MKTILLNPGPVTLSARVRAALQGPDLCHREPEFSSLQTEIRQKLLAVYDLPATHWAAVLLTGSGTSAVEAMLTSLIPANGRLLIIENGVYGERMSTIAERHRIPASRVAHEWLSGIDLERVESTLREEGPFTHVAAVHHETTSGRLNDIAALGALCKRHGATLLLDAVSSFAGEEIRYEEWSLGGLAGTANKCLHGVPGTSFAIVRRDALERARGAARTVYLDLHAYFDNQERGGTPFTQSVQTFYGLAAALEEFREEGGWRARHACYRTRMARVRSTLTGLGVQPLLPAGESSCVLNGFALPAGLGYPALHDGLKQAGFIIYAGQSRLASEIFRISTMGDISDDDLGRLCTALEGLITRR